MEQRFGIYLRVSSLYLREDHIALVCIFVHFFQMASPLLSISQIAYEACALSNRIVYEQPNNAISLCGSRHSP